MITFQYNYIIFCVAFLITLTEAKLTKSIFYQSDPLVYTPEFCETIQNNDFLAAIEKDSSKEAEKTKAFKTLFDSCRSWLLHDAVMAKNVIIPMIDTENIEYLPLLLSKGEDLKDSVETPKDKGTRTETINVKRNNIDLSSEIFHIALHLFTLNPALEPSRYFFLTRNPDKALSYLLAYTNVEKEDLERVREFLEAINNHPSKYYHDAHSVGKAIILVDGYLKHPQTIGNHKLNIIEPAKYVRSASGSWIAKAGIILGAVSIIGIIVGLVWKSKYKAIQ